MQIGMKKSNFECPFCGMKLFVIDFDSFWCETCRNTIMYRDIEKHKKADKIILYD
jgi:thiol-disulfide isomerase/thioredoxin